MLRRNYTVVDPHTGQEAFTLKLAGDAQSLAFSPNGKLLAFSHLDGTINLWDVRTQKELLVINAHTATANGVAFSPDGKRLVSTGVDGATKLWDVVTGQQVLSLKVMSSVGSAGFSPDGLRLAIADSTVVEIWDARTAKSRTLSAE